MFWFLYLTPIVLSIAYGVKEDPTGCLFAFSWALIGWLPAFIIAEMF